MIKSNLNHCDICHSENSAWLKYSLSSVGVNTFSWQCMACGVEYTDSTLNKVNKVLVKEYRNKNND